MPRNCTHLDQIQVRTSTVHTCFECEKLGDSWVHLRMCLTCGHVGCCDSSENQHATKHFNATEHPLIRSIEPGESWMWCYPDRAMVGDADVRTSAGS